MPTSGHLEVPSEYIQRLSNKKTQLQIRASISIPEKDPGMFQQLQAPKLQ